MSYLPSTSSNQDVNIAPRIIWTGKSGTTYEMQLNPVGALYKDRPGIYIACVQLPTGNWGGLYVGQTKNFDVRIGAGLANHHRWPSIRASGGTHFCTLHWTGGEAQRLLIEDDLIQGLNPPCNRTY